MHELCRFIYWFWSFIKELVVEIKVLPLGSTFLVFRKTVHVINACIFVDYPRYSQIMCDWVKVESLIG